MPCDPRVSEWANPAGSNPRDPPAEHIRGRGATRGTETSKYPEEEKSTETPRVAASERGRGQTGGSLWRRRGCGAGYRAVTKPSGSGTAWDGRRNRVRAPYANRSDCQPVPEYRRTRGTRWEAGGTTLQA